MSSFLERLYAIRDQHETERSESAKKQNIERIRRQIEKQKKNELEKRLLTEAAVPVLRELKQYFGGQGEIQVLGRDEKVKFPDYDSDTGNTIHGPSAVLFFDKKGNDTKGSIKYFDINLEWSDFYIQNGEYLILNNDSEYIRKSIEKRIIENTQQHGILTNGYFSWDKYDNNPWKNAG